MLFCCKHAKKYSIKLKTVSLTNRNHFREKKIGKH